MTDTLYDTERMRVWRGTSHTAVELGTPTSRLRTLFESTRQSRPWVGRAACRDLDPAMFFPERGHKAADAAKAVCAFCAVRAECLGYALAANEREGVWGGTTDSERRKLKRRAS